MRKGTGELGRGLLSAVEVAALALVVGAALATPLMPSARAATWTVNISSFTFIPHELSVSVGDSVTWTNSDSFTHTVTSNNTPAEWPELTLNPGGSGTVVFDTQGVFGYHCRLHPPPTYPGMWGEITVGAAIPELSNAPFVVLGLMVVFFAIIVAGRKH